MDGPDGSEGGADALVGRGVSRYYRRDGAFTIALGLAFVPLQVVSVALSWTDSWFLPFGFCTAGCVAVAVPILLRGQHAPVCLACREGLEPNRYVDLDVAGGVEMRDALHRRDADAVLRVAVDHPRAAPAKGQHPSSWLRLDLEHCPSCGRVAVARLEHERGVRGTPGPTALGGPAVVELLAMSEVDVGS